MSQTRYSRATLRKLEEGLRMAASDLTVPKEMRDRAKRGLEQMAGIRRLRRLEKLRNKVPQTPAS